MGEKRPPPARPQLRIARDLDAWLADYAETNTEGLDSRSQVAEHAIREFKKRVEKEHVRRELFRAWVAKGRPWPPPPGLEERDIHE